MTNSAHPVEQEELMAYLDGELPSEQALRVAAHLEQCGECRMAIAETRGLSDRLADWQVEPSPPRLAEGVTAAVREAALKPPPPGPRPSAWRRLGLFRFLDWAWAAAGVGCVLLVVAAVMIPNLQRSRQAALNASREQRPALMTYVNAPAPAAISVDRMVGKAASQAQGIVGAVPGGIPGGELGGMKTVQMNAGPMIVRTAELILLTGDFEKTRAGVEDVVRRYHGYNAVLTVGSQTGSARTLTATFRLPADRLDAAIAEIKKLAHVEGESQGGEEVTEQFVDLTARLSNARRTEQQLVEILEKRTGKLSEVLEVEQELARIREEIERMEAQLKNLQNRVSFATLRLELREEYKAELEMTQPSIGPRLWNAMVEGFRSAADSLVGVVLFLMNVGPFLLLWGLILFWPARFVWRRLRASSGKVNQGGR